MTVEASTTLELHDARDGADAVMPRVKRGAATDEPFRRMSG